MWSWLLSVLLKCFGFIPTLVWNCLCWVWNTVLIPVLSWFFVDFLWGTVVHYLRSLLKYKTFCLGAIAGAYTFLKDWFTGILDFCIDTAFDFLKWGIDEFNIEIPDTAKQGLVSAFDYYNVIDSWAPLSETITMLTIYLYVWALMMLFKVGQKLWSYVVGS